MMNFARSKNLSGLQFFIPWTKNANNFMDFCESGNFSLNHIFVGAISSRLHKYIRCTLSGQSDWSQSKFNRQFVLSLAALIRFQGLLACWKLHKCQDWSHSRVAVFDDNDDLEWYFCTFNQREKNGIRPAWLMIYFCIWQENLKFDRLRFSLRFCRCASPKIL